MRKIRVQAGVVTEDNRCSVEWRVDEAQWKGVINVVLPKGVEDGPMIAELCALRHLVVDRIVFGSPSVPKTAMVIVSHGAIKKLMRQDSAKTHIIPYGRFLYAAMDQCAFDVKKDRALADLPRKPIFEGEELIGVTPDEEIQAFEAPWPTLKFKLLADEEVGISRHAIERYKERFETPYVASALTGLRKILSSDSVRELDKSEEAKARALMKHKVKGRIFCYPLSETYFVLVKESGVWVMATIYRDEEHKRLKETVYANGRIEVRRKK